MRRTAAALLAAAALATPRETLAEALTVAAAADLKYALEGIVAAFRAENPGADVKVSYGSSGSLYARIANGAPFDLFFSADASYPRRLAESQLAVAESLTPYAVGRLALWVPNGSPLDVGAGLPALRDPRVRRIAIANPAHAPYGRAAEAALASAGLLDAVKPRLVLGEDAAQAAQFVESGNADAALLPLSLVLAPPLAREGRHAVVPGALHAPIEQVVVVTSHGRGNPAAALLRFVVGPEGRAILERWGLVRPGS